jgi:outer membrane biosynthesis protein TonB
MKPRVLTPHKILAAVLTVTCAPAAAGAATALAAPAPIARVSPPTDDAGYPLVGNLVRKGDPPKPAPPPPKPKPSPAPKPEPKPALR